MPFQVLPASNGYTLVPDLQTFEQTVMEVGVCIGGKKVPE